jgi:hypothetical protein
MLKATRRESLKLLSLLYKPPMPVRTLDASIGGEVPAIIAHP